MAAPALTTHPGARTAVWSRPPSTGADGGGGFGGHGCHVGRGVLGLHEAERTAVPFAVTVAMRGARPAVPFAVTVAMRGARPAVPFAVTVAMRGARAAVTMRQRREDA
jgi:hypothetical protein